MKVIFTELAHAELSEACIYYELEFSGLGKRFKREVKKAVKRIIQFPLAWQKERGDVRKCLLHKFPYKILYSIESDHLLIIAIAHLHRKPDYWVNEL
ncbi:MAG: type II toxin-antitoxin system RelE/ParE family toxin [Methylobacter sp.]